MAWSRALVVCALLAVSALSGVRIVCVIEPQPAGSPAPGDALACQTFCSTHPTSKQLTSCALVEDPTCAYAIGSAAAVLPDAPLLPFTVISEPFERAYHAAYPHPALDRASPPPKA